MAKPPRAGISALLDDLSLPDNSSHPIGSPDFTFEEAENIYLMDPRKIVLEGTYVRRWFHDPDFDAFCEAIRENGDIGQPLGVRSVGSMAERRIVLIYGMRRWKASLRSGLAMVPVRDYGPISEAESVALQMMENEIRAQPHPVDTAFGYHLLSRDGWAQKDITLRFGVDQGYVSYMLRVGAAVAEIDDEARGRLYRSPAVTVRAFQELAKIKDVAERTRELLRLATGAPSPVREAVERRRDTARIPFQVRQHRDGRSFRFRWKDEDLTASPDAFIGDLTRHVLDEYGHLEARLDALRDGAEDPALRTKIERALENVRHIRAGAEAVAAGERGDGAP